MVAEIFSQKQRRKNIAELKNIICRLRQEKGYIYVKLETFVYSIGNELGLRAEKIFEYLKILQAQGYVDIDDKTDELYFMRKCDDEITIQWRRKTRTP